MSDGFELGWYHIDEVWHLYVDVEDGIDDTHRRLKHVRVDYINVDEHPDDRDAEEGTYHVDHYDPSGDLITSASVTEEDLRDVVGDRETTDRPMHI